MYNLRTLIKIKTTHTVRIIFYTIVHSNVHFTFLNTMMNRNHVSRDFPHRRDTNILQ